MDITDRLVTDELMAAVKMSTDPDLELIRDLINQKVCIDQSEVREQSGYDVEIHKDF